MVHRRHFDTELLSYHEEDGHHLEDRGRDLTVFRCTFVNFMLAFSFTWAWDLHKYAHTHAFTGVRSEAQSTVVLHYHSINFFALLLLSIFFAILVHIVAHYFLCDPRILLSINFSRDLRYCQVWPSAWKKSVNKRFLRARTNFLRAARIEHY